MRVQRVSAKTGTLLVGLLVISLAQISHAQTRPGIRPFVATPKDCYVTDPVETENIYLFTRVQILALSLAQRGEHANIKMLQAKGGAPFEEIDKTIAGLREELIENTCASFVVSYYVDSGDQTMATVAKYLAYAYDQLGKMSDQMLGINLQKALDTVNGVSPQRQLSQLLEERQKILQGITDAVNLSLDLLIDNGHVNEQGKPDHLILKKAQIEDLLDYLYQYFPSLKDNHGPEPSSDFVKQAALIQSFLTGSYKPADSGNLQIIK